MPARDDIRVWPRTNLSPIYVQLQRSTSARLLTAPCHRTQQPALLEINPWRGSPCLAPRSQLRASLLTSQPPPQPPKPPFYSAPRSLANNAIPQSTISSPASSPDQSALRTYLGDHLRRSPADLPMRMRDDKGVMALGQQRTPIAVYIYPILEIPTPTRIAHRKALQHSKTPW